MYMYMYIYVYIYIYIHLCMYVCMYVGMYVCVNKNYIVLHAALIQKEHAEKFPTGGEHGHVTIKHTHYMEFNSTADICCYIYIYIYISKYIYICIYTPQHKMSWTLPDPDSEVLW